MKWTLTNLFQLYIYIAACVVAILLVPNRLWHPETHTFVVTLGAIGLWRYSWWFTHYSRSIFYQRVKYPPLRALAERYWLEGWRPRQLHIVVTTYKENPDTTRAVFDGICAEVERHQIPTVVWVVYGFPSDRETIREWLRKYWNHLKLETTFIQQAGDGKRIALGVALRAMSRYGVRDDDLVVLMDGDSIIQEGVLAKCASVFGVRPDVHAVTTDEDAIVHGPSWVQSLLALRFTQRRINMLSCAVSERVLTLTGRFSMFRAKYIMEREAIETLENDFLDNWLWGKFRFLSGDDKSTWYHLLKRQAPMLYIPDAMVYTVEYIEGNGLERVIQNYRRWSGNMLRNGSRAIALGPHHMPFFIWWCLIDQRFSMWTSLIAPISALIASVTVSPIYLLSFAIWVAVSRLVLFLLLVRHAYTVDFRWPFLLYFSQIVNAVTKIGLLFRLAQQRWSNRGNQTASGGTGRVLVFRRGMAFYLTGFYVVILILVLATLQGVLVLPGNWLIRDFLDR